MLVPDSSEASEYGIRLVSVVTHAHEGDSLDVFFYLGNSLNPCGEPQNNDIAVYTVTPEGKRQNLDMVCRKEDCCTYRITVGKEGIYHLFGECPGYFSVDGEGKRFKGSFEDNPEAVSATRCFQYAHTVLQVGRNPFSAGSADAMLPPLCIVPDSWDSLRVGEVFAFTLYFRDFPLPLHEIGISYSVENGRTMSEEYITDGKGRMLYPINTPGKYFIVIRYNSKENDERLYYDTRYTYSFWFKARA